ncbi:MAG: hypothetical protein V2B15_16705 [Bacteroidota bacterium]
MSRYLQQWQIPRHAAAALIASFYFFRNNPQPSKILIALRKCLKFKTLNIMSKIKCVLLSIVVFGLLFSCKQTLVPETQQTESLDNTHYVSIDGLWRVTPETSIKYPHGTLEPILQFHTDAQGKLTAQGCFLWDKRFYDYWPFRSIQFNDSTRQLVIGYNEEGTYKGIVDYQTGIIQGTACGGDPSDTNKLDFKFIIRHQHVKVVRPEAA